MSVSAPKDLDILQLMLTIVTLATLVSQIVTPNQNCMPRSTNFHFDLLASVALDHELLLVVGCCCLDVVKVDATVFFVFSHYSGLLPGK